MYFVRKQQQPLTLLVVVTAAALVHELCCSLAVATAAAADDAAELKLCSVMKKFADNEDIFKLIITDNTPSNTHNAAAGTGSRLLYHKLLLTSNSASSTNTNSSALLEYHADFHTAAIAIKLKHFSSNKGDNDNDNAVVCQVRQARYIYAENAWLNMTTACVYHKTLFDGIVHDMDFRILNHQQTCVLGQFTLHIEKPKLASSSKSLQNQTQPITCTLTQDCNVRLFTDGAVPCGLQPLIAGEASPSWQTFLEEVYVRLPVCDTQAALNSSGQWVLPCDGACSTVEYAQCDWRAARWLPNEPTCRLRSATTGLEDCVQNVTIAKIGDSTINTLTNAIMSLMQPLENGTRGGGRHHCLDCWYSEKQDFLERAFYYNPDNSPCFNPQFKFEMPRHCKFAGAADTALEWLREQRVENPGRKLILIIGAASYITDADLIDLRQMLREYRFDNLTVIVRGHVASYFASDTGVFRHYDASMIAAKQFENDGLLKTASRLGFIGIDSWGLTTSRWKEFYEQYCQCHHYPDGPGDWYLNATSTKSWIENNSILRAEVQTLATGICMAQ